MALYQDIMKVPGLSGSAYDRQSQLYSKLGAPKGGYTGSYDQNIWLLGEIGRGNYGAAPAPAAAPAAPAGKSSQQLYDERVASDNAARQALITKQNAEQEGLFGSYETTLKGQESGNAIYDRLKENLGINSLGQTIGAFKGQIFQVNDLLDRLDEDITSRTQGTRTSDAMRRRIQGHEEGDLRNQLGRLGTGLTPVTEAMQAAQGELGTRMNLTLAEQQKELDPIKMRINAISDRFAREMTGFQQEHEDTLNSLMDKLNRDRELSDRDWELAQKLAAEERDWSRQKELAKMQLSAKASAGSGGVVVGGGGSGGQAQTAQVNPRQQALQTRMSKVLDNYATKYNAGYIDRTAIPVLQKEFPEWASAIPGMVYSYIK